MCLSEGQISWNWNYSCVNHNVSGNWTQVLWKKLALLAISPAKNWWINYQFQVIHSLIPKGFTSSPYLWGTTLTRGGCTDSEPSLFSHRPFLRIPSCLHLVWGNTDKVFILASIPCTWVFCLLVLKVILMLSSVTCWTGQNPQSPLDLRLLKPLPVPRSHWIQESLSVSPTPQSDTGNHPSVQTWGNLRGPHHWPAYW